MKIGVTGATGFIGSHLLDQLIHSGLKTVCFIRKGSPNQYKLRSLNTEVRFIDLNDTRIPPATFSDLDIVYHLAGSVFDIDKDVLFETNAMGTENLYRALRHSPVKRFIFLSSLAAIGPVKQDETITEDTIPHPISHYGASKLEAEKRLRVLRTLGGKEICILRAPLTYGIGMSLQSRLSLLIKQLKGGKFKILGSGDNFISLCQIKNLTDALINVMRFKNVGYEIFHVSDPVLLTLEQVVTITARQLAQPSPVVKIPRVVALGCGYMLDYISKIFPGKFYLSSERVREITGNWRLNLNKIRSWGFTPTGEWEGAYLETIRWLSGQVG